MKLGEFLESFKSLWGAAVVAAGAGPLALWLASLEPPWPSGAGSVATLFCAIAVLIAFQVSQLIGKANRANKIRYIAIATMVLGLLGTIVYLAAYGRYVETESIQLNGQVEIIRMVVGSELRPGIQQGPNTNLDLLRDFLYEPEAIWTAGSIAYARMILLTTFVLSFFLLTFGASIMAPLKKKPDQ